MDIVRQDNNSNTQRYHFHTDKHAGWDIVYTAFFYPDNYDKPFGAVDESLEIIENFPNNPIINPPYGEEGHFRDAFFLIDGRIRRAYESMGLSPTLSRLKGLNEETLDKIKNSLSAEARNLFDRGLESYIEPK